MWSLEDGRKTFRLTFSKSLAEYLQRLRPHLSLVRRTFTTGRALARGESSPSGAYAIVDTRKFKTLRITLDRRIADLLASDTRIVFEAWLL